MKQIRDGGRTKAEMSTRDAEIASPVGADEGPHTTKTSEEELDPSGMGADSSRISLTPSDGVGSARGPMLRRPSVIWGVRGTLFIVLVLAWEVSSGRVIEPYLVSQPSDIGLRLAEMLRDADFYRHALITLQETLWGFLLGSAAGIVSGFALGRMVFLGNVLDPFVQAFYSLPKIALAPLFVLWFGIGMTMKVVLAAVLVFFLIFWNTLSGVRDVNRDLVNSAKVMGANRWTILTKIVTPSAMSQILVGLKLAVPYALIGAVVGELIAANKGLGYLIVRSVSQYDTAGVFSTLIILMFLATVMNEGVNSADKHLGRWRDR